VNFYRSLSNVTEALLYFGEGEIFSVLLSVVLLLVLFICRRFAIFCCQLQQKMKGPQL